MSAHAKKSPSKASRWLACPASVREEAKYPESRDNAAAIDGTHSHTLLETVLKQAQWSAAAYIGQKLSDHDGEFVVESARAARVQVALDYIKGRLHTDMRNVGYLKTEQRVNPEKYVKDPDCSGTADVQLFGIGVLEIIDYKDGMGIVEAKDNPQLELYALGAIAESSVNQDTVVRMTIVQPKLADRNMPAVSWSETTVGDLIEKSKTFAVGAAAANDPDAKHVPGDAQCKWCKASGNCAARAQWQMEQAGIVFGNINKVEVAQQAADKDPNELTDEQLRELVESAPLLRQLLEAAEAEALRRMEAGHTVPGLKLVRGRGSRSWSLPDDEIANRLVKMGVPKSSAYVTKVVSPAQVAKLSWEKKSRDGAVEHKSLSEKQIKLLESEYITKSSGKLTVAPESDNREAVIVSAASMFSAVIEQDDLPAWLK